MWVYTKSKAQRSAFAFNLKSEETFEANKLKDSTVTQGQVGECDFKQKITLQQQINI